MTDSNFEKEEYSFDNFVTEVIKAFESNVRKIATNGVSGFGNNADVLLYTTCDSKADRSQFTKGYLNAFEEAERQSHNCECCRVWLRECADLVFISDSGDTVSAFWDPEMVTDPKYKVVAARLKELAESRRVVSAWVKKPGTFGFVEQGGFSHFHATIPTLFKVRGSSLTERTNNGSIGLLNTEYDVLKRTIDRYSKNTVDLVKTILNSPGVFKSNINVPDRANYISNVYKAIDGVKHTIRKDNLIRRMANEAPAGFAGTCTSVLETMYQSVDNGDSADVALKRLNKLLDPLLYRRTEEEAVKKGQIISAMSLFKELGIDPDKLAFKYSTLETIPEKLKVWEQKKVSVEEPRKSIMEKLMNDAEKRDVPSLEITAIKGINVGKVSLGWFLENVLPKATDIKMFLDNNPDNYSHFFEGVGDDFPMIYKYDSAEDRLKHSCYSFHRGNIPADFGLGGNKYIKVNMIAKSPQCIAEPDPSKIIYIFLLDGVSVQTSVHAPLFPIYLRRELFSVANIVETIGKNIEITGRETANAVGIGMSMTRGSEYSIRATVDGMVNDYVLSCHL